MTEYLSILRGPSTIQSDFCFFSKRHSLHTQSSTSPYLSFRALTRRTSSPFIHRITFPAHLVQFRCASSGFVNHTRLRKRNVLSVKAPTGHTSIILPDMSLSTAF